MTDRVVCRIELKSVAPRDAAPIVPVAFPSSTDQRTNSLALCPLHRGADDRG